MVVDNLDHVIVSNVILGADTIVTDNQIFPETYSFTPNSDFFLAKYNSGGSLVWLKTILGESDCGSLDLDVDNEGNIYVGGIMQNSINVDGTLIERPTESLPQPGYFILKFNPQGQLQWYHKGDYKSSRCYRLAWTGTELAFVLPYSDSVEIGGEVFYSDGDSFLQDMVLGKLDSDGNLISAVNIGGEGNVEIHALECDAQGCILQGRFDQELSYDGVTVTTPAELHFELYQLSIAADFSLNWLNASQSLAGIDPRAYGLGLSEDGHAYFSGNYWNSSFVLGDVQLPLPNESDFFVGKLGRSDGAISWLKRGSGMSFEGSSSLITANNSIKVAGTFYSETMDYEGISFVNSPDEENDGFLLSLELDGKVKCGFSLAGIGQNGILRMDAFANGFISVLGYFNGTIELDSEVYTAQGNYDLLITKTCLPCDTVTSISENLTTTTSISIYPNPASQSVRLEVAGSHALAMGITITDLLGHAVLSLPFGAVGEAINISNLANGIYTISATIQSRETLRQRLVVQH